MKKFCILLACLSGLIATNSFANWDSVVVSQINYDTTTCTLKITRSIGGHHVDIYSHEVIGPVIINIPIQGANIA